MGRWLVIAVLGFAGCGTAPVEIDAGAGPSDAGAIEVDAPATPAASTPMGDAGALSVGVWEERARLLDPNSECAVAELDGLVYVIGGYPSTRVTVDTVQVYDVA